MSKKYLYQSIKEKIKNDTKDLKPGSRIPSRVELIKQYNVTHTTIEKAISELIGEGYLYTLEGSGTFIAKKEDKSKEISIQTWGLIIPNILTDTYPGILRGVEDFAHEKDINIVVCNTDHDIAKQDHYIRKLVSTKVNGIIIVPAIYSSSADFQYLVSKKIPFVFCNRGVWNINAPQILSNNYYGSYLATKHLINIGYKNIAFLSYPYYSHTVARYQGYLAALYEHNMPIHDELVIFESSFDDPSTGYESGKQLFSYEIKPDAVVCCNDSIAKGLYKAVAELGLVVGKDLGVIGYDDSTICEMLPVKLTSIYYPKYETGYTAAQVLWKLVNGEKINKNYTKILKPELRIRESCGYKRKQELEDITHL
ncbi:MAG TPA: substrate-binding domain-containing protein [Clostridiales bacterium]|nr:substrate-binding domain-containing protein [Clostridiales bacterium]